MEYYSSGKIEELNLHVLTGINHEKIMLSEKSKFKTVTKV